MGGTLFGGNTLAMDIAGQGLPPRGTSGFGVNPRLDALRKKYGSGTTKPGTTKPAAPVVPTGPQPLNWQFPQYSQTWAFTPPTPMPVLPPSPFNASSTSSKTTSRPSGSSKEFPIGPDGIWRRS